MNGYGPVFFKVVVGPCKQRFIRITELLLMSGPEYFIFIQLFIAEDRVVLESVIPAGFVVGVDCESRAPE